MAEIEKLAGPLAKPPVEPVAKATPAEQEALTATITTTPETKVYHGTHQRPLDTFINERGDLVLEAGDIFRKKGVSFSADVNEAQHYAETVKGSPRIKTPSMSYNFV